MAVRGLILTLALLLGLPATGLTVTASVVTLLRQSQHAAVRGQVEQALEFVNQALAQDPAYPPLWNQKASLQIRTKDFAGALDTLAVALRVEPDSPETNILALTALLGQDAATPGGSSALGQYLTGLGEPMVGVLIGDLLTRPTAKADLARFLAAWKPATTEGRAVARLAGGYVSGDQAVLSDLAEVSDAAGQPVLAALQFYAGKDMLSRKRFDLAGRLLKRAGANGYDQVAVTGELGWVLYNQGQYAAAADVWERVWRDAPDVGRWAAWIADARLAAKDYRRAADFLEKSLQFDPASPVLQGRYLLALTASGQTEAAERFEAGLAGSADQDGLSFGQALLAWRDGAYVKAAEAFGRIANRKPFRDQIIELANQMVAQLDRAADPAGAIAAVRALVEGMDIKAAILRDIGWRLWAAKAYAGAVSLFREALAEGLGNEDPLLGRLVPLLIERDRTSEALALLRRYAPQVTPLGLAWTLAATDRWDLVARVVPAARPGPYTELLWAMAELTGGQAPRALERLRGLAGLDAWGLGQAAVAGIDADGRLVKGTLTPAVARGLYLRLAKALVDQQLVDGFFFLTPPAWADGIAPKSLAPILAGAGELLWRLGRLDEAAALLTKAMADDPSLAEARLYLALVRKRQGRGTEAQALLDGAMAQAAPTQRDYVLGEFALLDGQPDKALEHFGRFLAAVPGDGIMRLRLIGLLVAGHRFTEARALAGWFEDRVAKADRTQFGVAAAARLDLGDPAGAEALYRRILAANPGAKEGLTGLGLALNRQSRYAETVAALAPAYAASPDPALGTIVCEALLSLGRYAEAERQAALGLAGHPEDKELLRQAAEGAEFARDLPACEAYARRYLERDPDSVNIRGMLGRVLLDQEKFDEARAYFEAVLARQPRNVPALRGLLGLYQATGQAAPAHAVAQKLLAAAPDDAAIRLRFAIAAASDQAFRPAYPVLEGLRDFGPGAAVLCLYYADVRDAEVPGRLRLSQFSDHLRALAARGVAFLGPDDLAARPMGAAARQAKAPAGSGAVVVLVDRTTGPVLEAMDRELAAVGGKAVLVVGGESLVAGTPYLPDPDQLARLTATGRWSLALTDHDPPAVDAGGGRRLGLWQAMAETGPDTVAPGRLAARLRSLDPQGLILKSARPVFFHPGGIAPDLADSPGPAEALVERTFPMAFALTSEGYWTPLTDPRRLAAKAVSPDMDAAALATWLDQADPLHQTPLELAKVNSWQQQTVQAEADYAEAASLKVNPAELAYNRAVNAYYAGDDPEAARLAREAAALAPDAPRTAVQLFRAELRLRPRAEASATTWWDSDYRRYAWAGAGGQVHVRDDLSLFARGGVLEWSLARTKYRDKASGEPYRKFLTGQDLTLGGRWYFRPQYWLEIQGQLTGTDGGPGVWAGGQASVHGPIVAQGLKLDGGWELQLAHERIDTVEAVTDQIMADRASLLTHTRVLDFWDLFVNVHAIARTDGNNTGAVDGRLLRRLVEFPLLSLGYAFQFADSDRKPEQYWAPQGLATHLAYGSFGYAPARWCNVSGSLGYGLSRDRLNDWREVWRANAGMDITLRDRLTLSVKYAYFATPNYSLNEAWAGITFVF